jgi:hypothetical protein
VATIHQQVMQRSGTPALTAVHAEPRAVAHENPRAKATTWYAAGVGLLRVERFVFLQGSSQEREEEREVSEVRVRCAPGTFEVNDDVYVVRHSSGDMTFYDRERFTVVKILSVGDDITVIDASRGKLANIRQRGLESQA